MRVIMTFDFDDADRARITVYQRDQYGKRGLPKLATREQLRTWVGEAVDQHWIDVEDVESDIDARASAVSDR